jgi:NAD(P)-dependent dehydrogenase (short-subunit alcohol dehydrogenase family)
MGLGLTGKAAIVTGASRGIGKAIAGTLAREGCDVIAVARSGALLHELAAAGSDSNRRVNAINPGAIETDRLLPRIKRFAEAHALAFDEARRWLLKDMGVARFGSADEIAAAVTFLASPRAAYVQGGLVDIDGDATRTL